MTNISEVSPVAFTFDREAYNLLTKAMKSADTTAENKATPWAQATFSALLSRNDEGEATFTVSSMTAALCSVYKPKTASGKAATTIGALPDSPRARANSIKFCMDNIGVAGVKGLIAEFIAGNVSSFAALVKAVKAAVKADVAEPEETGEGEGEGEGEGTAPSQGEAPSVGDMLAGMQAYIEGLSAADIDAHGDALEAIHAAITAQWAASVPAAGAAVNG